MQISGEYGTELLLRYTDERLSRDLERRRIGIERRAESQARHPRVTIRDRFAALFGSDSVGVTPVHAAHR